MILWITRSNGVDRWNKSPFKEIPLHLRILRTPDKAHLCKLIGIHFVLLKYFTAGWEGKSEEYAHVFFFNRFAPIAGYDFRLEIGRIARYWLMNNK